MRNIKITTFTFFLCISLLVSCKPNNDYLNLHDITIYGNEENATFGYFYGTPRTLQIGDSQTTYQLEPNITEDSFAVKGALLINQEPHLREEIESIKSPVTVSRIPYTTDILLDIHQNTGQIVYFDGKVWFDLSGQTAGATNRPLRIIPTQRIVGLEKLAKLTDAEAEMLERALLPSAPYVLVELVDAPNEPRNISGIDEYRSSNFYLEQNILVAEDVPTTATLEPNWSILAGGDNATATSADFVVATSDREFVQLWETAYGNDLAKPTLPPIDFRNSSLVALFIGERPNANYTITIKNITVENNDVYVSLEEKDLPEEKFSTEKNIITSPWIILQISRANIDVAWIQNAFTNELIAVAKPKE